MTKKTALLGVHHQPGLTGVIAHVLESADYVSTCVDNLDDFLHKCQERPYDRYVMDLNLSVHGDNLEPTLQALSTLQKTGLPSAEAKRRLLGISGMPKPFEGGDSLVLRAKKQGIRALQKPFGVNDLLEDYVHFCSVEEAAELILHDPHGFFDNLTRMDLAIRDAYDLPNLQDCVRTSVRVWEPSEITLLRPHLEERQKYLRERYPQLDFPGIVYLIKTYGNEEGGFSYVRGNSIVIPQDRIEEFKQPYMPDHENTHLLMNANRVARERVARHLGFMSQTVDLSHPYFQNHLVHNPDVTSHYVIRVTGGDKEISVLPVAMYQGEYGGETLREAMQNGKLKLQLLEVDETRPVIKDGRPRLYNLDEVSGFQEKLGELITYAAPLDEAIADLMPLILSGKSSHLLSQIDALLK